MSTSTILSDNGVSSGTSGIKTSGGNDGTLVLQTTTAGGAATTALTIDTSQNTTLAGTLTHPLGSAGSPSITFTGDTNTGIYSSGADTVVMVTGGTAAQTIDSGQRTKFPTTIGVGGATPSTSGSGVSFPATQSASTDANTLDDYEEGTWTPTVYGQTTAGVTTYTGQVGSYVKVGKSVTILGRVAYSAATGTGNMIMGGLPFTCTDSLNGTGSIMTDGLNWTGGTSITLFVASGTSTMQIYGSSDDGALSRQGMTNESVDMYFSATYIANA